MTERSEAILLAAGRGSRLGALTADAPKCLCPVAGHPLIAWQRAALRAAKVEHVSIVTGYRAALLAPYADSSFHNPDWMRTNMVRSLLCALPRLDRPVVVAYSDIVYTAAHVAQLLAQDAPLAITVDMDWEKQWSARFADPLSDAESLRMDRDGRVLEIGSKPSSMAEVEGQFMGLLRITPEAVRWINRELDTETDANKRNQMDMTTLLARLIQSGHPVQGIRVSGQWAEVDAPDDIAYAETVVTHPDFDVTLAEPASLD